MDSLTRAKMLEVFDALGQEELDDVESQFENTNVLWEQMREEGQVHHGHYPALELHVGEISSTMHGLLSDILSGPYPDEMIEGMIMRMMFDFIKASILFGRRVGETGWPVRFYECAQCHKME